MVLRRASTCLAAALLLAVLAGAAGAAPAAAQQVRIINGYGRCLDAQGRTLQASVTTMDLWDCHSVAALNQEWYVDAVPGSVAVRIRSADNGHCLDVPRGSGNGATVVLDTCAGSSSRQEWLIKGDHIVNVAVPSRTLDAWLSKIKSNGTPVDLWQPNGQAQQNWFQYKISGSITATPSALAVADGQVATTTISWSAPGAGARLWVSAEGGPRTLFATGQSGSKVATIPPGTSVFTLTYGIDPNEVLTSRSVTAVPEAGSPGAAAGPCVSQHSSSAMQLTAAIAPHAATDAQSGTIRFGGGASVTGELMNAQGAGVAGAEVCLVTEADTGGSPMQLAGSAVTGPTGQFVLPIPVGPSRTAWVVSGGAASVLETAVHVAVQTRILIHPNRTHLRNRQVLSLSGSIPGPIPARGVLVQVEVWRGTYWQTFETTHTDANGNYAARYRFSFTTVNTKYRMRTAVPEQSSYAYLGNRSRSVVIHVRGGRAHVATHKHKKHKKHRAKPHRRHRRHRAHA